MQFLLNVDAVSTDAEVDDGEDENQRKTKIALASPLENGTEDIAGPDCLIIPSDAG